MDRLDSIKKLQQQITWDIIIIGGGATGLGIAVDAARRGFTTLLLEQSDFAKGTSSRSTKLIHGGVRYLAQGNISLVYAALKERGLLFKNAPHVVKKQSFIIPCYSTFSKLKYLTGLKLYDWLSGSLSFGRSRFINKKELLKRLPAIKERGLKGGIEYFDGQFDDARLAINLAQTSVDNGGVVLNYIKVKSLLKNKETVNGVAAVDLLSNIEYKLSSKIVINATGVFVDDILQMNTPGSRPIVQSSQGTHLVFDKSFLHSEHAVMIPKTTDGRVLFAVPWHDHILVGTTDTPLNNHSAEPVALNEEINFILKNINQYFSKPVSKNDVLSVFAGLRPLAAPQKETGSTKEISRDHKLIVSTSGLITITGGKWTTYRKMAEVTVNKAIETGGLKNVSCKTRNLPVHGFITFPSIGDHLEIYGSDQQKIKTLIREDPQLNEKIIEGFPYLKAEVIWAIRNEMAQTVEDILARRIRLLFLDAKAAIQATPVVAEIMKNELGYNEDWKNTQLENFYSIAKNYLLITDQ